MNIFKKFKRKTFEEQCNETLEQIHNSTNDMINRQIQFDKEINESLKGFDIWLKELEKSLESEEN